MILYPNISSAEHAIGSIIEANKSPGSGWVKCDGSNYLKASYPIYVSNCFDLHPQRFQTMEKKYFTNTPSVQVKSVAINGDVIVLVGGTTRYHWRSSDGGDNWTEYSTNLPSSQDWRIVRYANSQFVAAGYNSTAVAYSSDGITWNSATLSGSGNWEYLYWDGTQWILAAASGGTYYTSSNGSSWTQRSSLPNLNNSGIAIDLNNNELMIMTDATNPYTYHSTDGINWTNKEYWQYMLRPYDVTLYPGNIMYFPDADKWMVLMDDYNNYGTRLQAWESINDGDYWNVRNIGNQWADEYQYFIGGSLWDGDCNIWFDDPTSYYVRGYWMNEAGGLNAFPGTGGQGMTRCNQYNAEYENCLITLDWIASEANYDYINKYLYGDYDPSTYFCVPNLSQRHLVGFESYIRLE